MFAIVEWLLLIVEIISCLLLIVVILLQKSRSEGLGMAFGASMGENLFGARATNVLTKITIWLGATFLVTTTLLAMLYAHRSNATTGYDMAPYTQPAELPLDQQQPFAQPLPAFPSAPDAAPEQQAPAPIDIPLDLNHSTMPSE